MFDTRLLEKITSVIMLLTVGMFPLGGLVIMLAGLAFGTEGFAVSAAMGCCVCACGVIFGAGFQGLLKWSRTGKARPFLESMARRLGGGDVSTASWSMSTMSPRLEGTLHGFPYTFTLRRKGGILSSSEVGGGGLGWTFTARMDASIGCKIGFGPPGQTMGAGLLGLSHDVQANGMTVWTGGTARGQQLAQYLSRSPALRNMVNATRGLLICGPTRLSITARVPSKVTPERMASVLEETANVARAATRG